MGDSVERTRRNLARRRRELREHYLLLRATREELRRQRRQLREYLRDMDEGCRS